MSNLRFKWVGRWSPPERQFRFFRVMWESTDRTGRRVSHKISASIKRGLPRVTHRLSLGGLYV